MENKSVTYKDAGVDIDAGNRLVDMIKPMVKSTSRPEVLTEIGGFGGLFSFQADKYKKPTLVSATDGVGTKLKLAFDTGKHDTVGIDLVAMCVNDIIVQGAEPLFFLDYLATGKLSPEKAATVVGGIAEGCRQAGCALIGGETAEMPGFYPDDEYDLAGFCVGAVDNDLIINGSDVVAGDIIIGIGSSGLHSNGFSLARKIFFDIMGLSVNDTVEGLEQPIGLELLTPTKIYVKSVLNLIRDFKIKSISHITGGGILENIPRCLPQSCTAKIDPTSWDKPKIFDIMKKAGNIEENEMYRTFNNGIGMVLVVPKEQHQDIMQRLRDLNERAWVIGEIGTSNSGTSAVELI
ncbi:MAG: phosphoribosylformylglycinamidine cyclo-ligase [Desulfuromonadaceae bacterium]|nr:phosphoribosylformylglycinamidine cyclo-ligase [Desulfuromonadaceae bacterium]